MNKPAHFFDGNSVTLHDVVITASPSGIVISRDGEENIVWPYSKLEAIETPHPDRPLRLLNTNIQGARLIISDAEMKMRILELAPELEGGINIQRAP